MILEQPCRWFYWSLKLAYEQNALGHVKNVKVDSTMVTCNHQLPPTIFGPCVSNATHVFIRTYADEIHSENILH